MNWKEKQIKNQLTEKDWTIVEERLKTMSNKMRLGILSNSFTQQELLVEVQKKSEVGRAYVEMQLEFIKWLVKQSMHQSLQQKD